MNRRELIVGGVAGLVTAGLAGNTVQAADWVTLYNGTDLSGWHAERGKITAWKANGELISCTGGGGGYLATDKEYGDFELRLQYKIGPGGNSGIGIRFPRGGWPSTDAMEIQILDDDHPNYAKLKDDQRNGSIYTHSAPKARAHKPAGEWNEMYVRCQGPHVLIRLNGVEIQNANLDDFADSLGKGKVVLAKRPRRGLIGLQNHNSLVDFRKVEVREL